MTTEYLVLVFCIAPFVLTFMVSTNAVLIGVIFANARAVAKVKAWSLTTGSMITSEMKLFKIGRTRSLMPVVEYTYQVNGQSYKGDQLLPSAGMIGGSLLKKAMARHPVGAQTTVYYNPQNPAESVLEKTSPVVGFLVWALVFSDIAMCAIIPYAWWLLKLYK